MSRVAGVILFQAKPGLGGEVSRCIAEALPAVEKEAGTTLWLVLQSRSDSDAVFLVDLFDGDASLQAHMKGDAAKLIFATVPELLAKEPELHPSLVVASKTSR